MTVRVAVLSPLSVKLAKPGTPVAANDSALATFASVASIKADDKAEEKADDKAEEKAGDKEEDEPVDKAEEAKADDEKGKDKKDK